MGDVGARDDQLDPLEVFERSVANLDRSARHDIGVRQATPEFFQPKRIRDGVAIDECDPIALRLPHAEIPPCSSRSSVDVEVDEIVSLFVPADNIPGRVFAVRVDDNDLERWFLDDQAVEEGGDVPCLVADRRDDADEQRGS